MPVKSHLYFNSVIFLEFFGLNMPGHPVLITKLLVFWTEFYIIVKRSGRMI